MALVLGTSSGFVAVAPTADPDGQGGARIIDGASVVTKDTSPSNAVKITEIGFYRSTGTNTANFEVALYSNDSDVAGARLFVDATNSSAASGWITTAVDWAISPSTAYWLGLQMDAHTGDSAIDQESSGGAGIDVRTTQTTLNDPYGGGAVADADGMFSIYAKYQAAPTVALNTPADASSDSDTTPILDFTGTDVNLDDIRFNAQIDTVNTFDSTTGAGPVYDTSVKVTGDGVNSFIFPALTTAEDNEVLICEVHFSNGTPSAVTFNGSLTWTKIGTEITVPSAGGEVYHYWAMAPTALSAVQFTATFTGGGFPQCSGIISAYKDVHPTAPIGDDTTGTVGAGTAVSATVITTAANSLVIAMTGQTGAQAMSPGAGETEVSEEVGQAFSRSNSTVQDAITTNASTSVQMDVTVGSNSSMAMRAIELLAYEGPLLDKVSGTDAGFANPDVGGDTDPFTSGDNIQYTVQSALSPTTYYWRVRGIDPSGLNTYGAWATTRSFTITAGGSTASAIFMTTNTKFF